MPHVTLNNKPLVEAIFEIHWKLHEVRPGVMVDPDYKLFLGRMYDKLEKDYPYHEELPSAEMPDEFVTYLAQHRFRKGENEWPLVQIGPGIVTVNDTAGYHWPDFKARIKKTIESLFKAYPGSKEALQITSLRLRYIDAMSFDFDENDAFEFLRDKMQIDVGLNQKLFSNKRIKSHPANFDFRFAFDSIKPKGVLLFTVSRGKKKVDDSDEDALKWDIGMMSKDVFSQDSKSEIFRWITGAYRVTHEWFFTLIEGELREDFE